jgi:cardiolipin synthase (CMP-forming)
MPMRSSMKTWLSTIPHGSWGVSRVVRWVVPNALSLLRIGLAIAFPWVPIQSRGVVIVVAAASDLLDGKLSRALHGSSSLGQILDPVADKLFVGMVLITLMLKGELALMELLLIGFRDLAVATGTAWSVICRGWGSLRHMTPSLLGKLATAGQFGFLLILTLGIDRSTSFFRLFEVAAAALSVLAGMDYLRRKDPATRYHETP